MFPKELAVVEDLDQVQIKFSSLEGLITLRVLNKETCLISFLRSLGGCEEHADSDENESKKMWAYTSQNFRCWKLCSSVGVKNRAYSFKTYLPNLKGIVHPTTVIVHSPSCCSKPV